MNAKGNCRLGELRFVANITHAKFERLQLTLCKKFPFPGLTSAISRMFSFNRLLNLVFVIGFRILSKAVITSRTCEKSKLVSLFLLILLSVSNSSF